MPNEAKFNYRSEDGSVKEGSLELRFYDLAERHQISARQIVNSVYSDADPRFGSAFEQGMRSLGIYTKSDPKLGIVPSTVRDVMTGDCTSKLGGVQLAASPTGAGTIVTPSAPIGSSTPASRFFFPEVVMAVMEEALKSDYSAEMAAFNSMLASDESIASETFTQPIINTQGEQGRSAVIGQNALPRSLVSITASQTSKAINTISVGLQISDQAQQHATIDLVGIILASQAEQEQKARLWEDLAAVVAGNLDAGQAALTPTLGTAYDSGFTNGVVTQTGWMKMLYDPSRKVAIDSIICTIDDLLAIQGRTGRPLIFDPKTSGVNLGNVGEAVFNVEPQVLNFGVGTPKIMLVPSGLWAAQNLLCFDSRYALRRVTNTSASYSAIEQMVLQRSSMMRFDTGSMIYRLRDEAFKLVDYS
jgi:hypothetical protein